MGSSFLLTVAIAMIILSTGVNGKITLHVGALLELSNHWYEKYVNFFVNIIEHVFEEVENMTDILENYSLKLITKDTQGKSGLAARQVLELMSEDPPIVAVLGPTLSKELTVVGQITPFYDVVQISYIALTSTTLEQELFSTLFMVNQIMDDINPLRIKMMQYFGWTRVGTIFFQNDIYVSHMNMFHDLVKQHNLTLLTSAVASQKTSDVKVLISRLVDYDVRIIMGTFSGSDAPIVFCEAFHRGLYGSDYVWILNGPVFDLSRFNKGFDSKFSCTYEQFLMVSTGVFTLSYDMIDANDSVTVSNLRPSQLKNIFDDKISVTPYVLSSFYGYVYDAAWALALGLNKSLSHLDETGLHNYTNNQYYLEAIMKGMHEVSFSGISGPVSFDVAGRRAGVTFIEQIFNTTKTRHAIFDYKTDNLTWFINPKTLWPGGEIPKDRFTYYRMIVPANIPALVLIMLANLSCLLLAVGFLFFNIHYRRNSNIKLSSPMINNIIIGGSILMFVCVLLTALDYGNILQGSVAEHICMIRVWLMCLGFTCLFGALFSKTWRVHILFRNNQLKRKKIRDIHLFGIVGFLLLIDCVILVPWSLIHSLQKKTVVHKTKDMYNRNDILAEVYMYCHHNYEGYWFISTYIYKGLLLVLGTFLAWETRHVTVPALNDSKYIGFCIYNVVTVCIFGVPLSHVLPTEQTTMTFVILSTLVMFCTTMCLCILFIPKIRIRNQVAGKFLNPSLNTKTASASGSDVKPSSGTDNSNLPEDKPRKHACRSAEDLLDELNRRKMQIEADTIAIERLKRLLEQAQLQRTMEMEKTENCKATN